MKTLLVSTLLLLVPLGVRAECSPSDFVVKDFKTSYTGAGSTMKLSLSGELVNNCATPSAAQIVVEAKSADGNVMQTKKAWPAGTTNIAPGASANFDLGRQFHLQAGMANYSVSVASVRTW